MEQRTFGVFATLKCNVQMNTTTTTMNAMINSMILYDDEMVEMKSLLFFLVFLFSWDQRQI